MLTAAEQLTATAEILRVIATAPTSLRRVLDAVTKRAIRVCDADDARIFRVDGEMLHLVTHAGPLPSPESLNERPLTREYPAGRAIVDRATLHILDYEAVFDAEFPEYARRSRELRRGGPGHLTVLIIPLLRDGVALGALSVRRRPIRPFSDREIALLESFADEAVIAIQNARLFEELEHRNAELQDSNRQVREALEQQTATADLLRVIASSPNDIQPVLQAVAETAGRLCDTDNVVIYRSVGDYFVHAASVGEVGQRMIAALGADHLGPAMTAKSVIGRAWRERRQIQVDNLATAVEEYPNGAASARRSGHRTTLATPLLRTGEPIGVICAYQTEVRPFSKRQMALLRTFADQAVIAIENARLFDELEQRNTELQESNRQVTEALAQQTATAEVLRAIASSPTDLQAVLDELIASAVRLAGAESGVVHRVQDGRLFAIAHSSEEFKRTVQARNPQPRTGRPLTPDSFAGRAFLTRQTIHVPDVLAAIESDFPDARATFELVRHRSAVAVPLMRQGTPIGILAVHRHSEARAFTEQQIALLETFADQAVIAIENARLFSELGQRNAELQKSNRQVTEALEQQTATAEILRVIASSPTELEPVLRAVAESAASVCGAEDAHVRLLEGNSLRLVAAFGTVPGAGVGHDFPAGPTSVGGLAVTERRTVHVPDIAAEPEDRFPAARALAIRYGFRAVLVAPLLRDGTAIGNIALRRMEAEPFTDAQIRQLETFADQAVVAIENTRLFQELEQRNRELSQALERQAATGEILRAIASSPADLASVLDATVTSALHLADADVVLLGRPLGNGLRYVARAISPRVTPAQAARMAAGSGSRPRGAEGGTVIARALQERRTIQHVNSDGRQPPEYPKSNAHRVYGPNALVCIPLLREGEPLGAITATRLGARSFSDEQIALLETFADQAAIAIENTRLFGELEQRNRDLSEALEQQTATAEVLRVIATSPSHLDQVLSALVASVARLTGADGASASRVVSEEELELVASTDPKNLGFRFPRFGGITGRAFQEGRSLRVHGSPEEQAAQYGVSQAARSGVRARAITPLLRDGQPIGTLNLFRHDVRPFTDREVSLLEAFADQAVIAIENARLFEALQEANGQLTEASRHKSQFLANMSHELRTPLNAIIGYSEMLQEEAEEIGEEAFIPDLQKVNAAGKHLLGLINDILDLSKIEAGRMDLFLETFEIKQLVRDVEAIVQPLVEKNGNTLVVFCPDDLGTMHADQTKLRQTLFNLLSNAAKFTSGGGIELRVARGEGRGGQRRLDGEDEEDGAEERGRLRLGPDRIDTWKPAPTGDPVVDTME